jgi:hypothetical protein
MIKNKVLFLHKPKTAGSYISRYFHKNDLSLVYLDGWKYHGRDWNRQELTWLANTNIHKCVSIVAHQHSNSIEEAQFDEFMANGWFSFMFMREPEEVIASWYHFLIDMNETAPSYNSPSWKTAQELSLDQFILNMVEYDEVWRMSSYWRDIDWLGLPTDEHFENLFNIIGIPYTKTAEANVSSNRGYYTYREEGLISDQTHKKLITSDEYLLQHEIIRKIKNRSK